MFKPKLNLQQWTGLLFVLGLHGVIFYELWSYRIIPTPVEAITVMVNLINPPPPLHQPPPKPPKPELPKPVQPQPLEPPPQQVAAAPVPAPETEKPVIYAPVAPPVVETAPPVPAQPVVLSGELSVSCSERPPPEYPRLSMRMNEQGKAVLRVELAEDGSIVHVEVKSSSGYKRLDEAALSVVRTWRCKPAMKNGVAVRSTALQPFNFIMEGK